MKIPNITHWAIITTSSVYIPGDERSRTNPGHGYPEHTVETINYEAFTDYISFGNRIEQLTLSNEKFRAIQAKPVEVETTVTIRLKE